MVIGSIKSNLNTPSFKGIVKVNMVLLNGKQAFDSKVIDSAAKQLKAILLKKNDTPDTFESNELLRKIYHEFDKDYEIPSETVEGDGRDVFTKVRTGKGGKAIYLVSGEDAFDISVRGRDIGSKKALERIDDRNIGLAQIAKDSYFSIKDEIASRYYDNEKRPRIYLYTIKDDKNITRLIGARMGDAYNFVDGQNPLTQKIMLNRKYRENSKPKENISQSSTKKSRKNSANVIASAMAVPASKNKPDNEQLTLNF